MFDSTSTDRVLLDCVQFHCGEGTVQQVTGTKGAVQQRTGTEGADVDGGLRGAGWYVENGTKAQTRTKRDFAKTINGGMQVHSGEPLPKTLGCHPNFTYFHLCCLTLN